MDADFEQHYQAAERAYGLGEYTKAIAPFRGLVELLEIGVHALGASPPVVDR